MNTRASLLFGVGVTVAVAIAVLAPRQDSPAAPGTPSAQGLPEGHPPLAPAGGAATAAQGPFATVLESMDSGGYTYARVSLDDEEMWVAGPATPLAEGDQISLAGAMGMENFHAASLDRTFESILFLNRFAGPAPAAAESSGTALEVLHAAGYTYVRVDQGGTEVWIAGMAMDIAEGAGVAWSGGAPMQNFESPSLGRTFEEILFVDGLRVTG